MSTRDIDIMIVDDEADIRNGLARLVGGTGARVRVAASGEEALALMAEYESELLLSDIKMRGMSGVELLRALRRHHPRTGVLLMTGFGTIELAVQCLQLGALHFLTKPFDNEEILETIERLAARVSADRAAMSPGTDEKGFVASDRAMRPVMEAIDHVAGTRIPVLIQGESGTGKEVVARAIHEAGGAERPLVAVNCAAIPDALLESELFGHRKGAFTGADRNHDGVFQRADGGTLFLDEVPSMSPAFQAKLLRVLQDKTFTPLGAERQHTADFRLIAATNRDLRKMVTAGEFREDLFYRLNVFTIAIPPLRERVGDIEALARLFLRRAARGMLRNGATAPPLTREALDELRTYDWPGNVRELENAVQRAVIMCRDSELLPHHFLLGAEASAETTREVPLVRSYEEAKQQLLDRFQRQFLQRILERTNGNISRAAEECGLTRVAIQKMLRRLNMDRSDFDH